MSLGLEETPEHTHTDQAPHPEARCPVVTLLTQRGGVAVLGHGGGGGGG